MLAFPKQGLYAITDPDAHHSSSDCLKTIESCLSAGVSVLQLRDKNHKLDRQTRLAIRRLCERYKVPFIINDDIEQAELLHADGVHLGQDDQTLQQARRRLGAQAIIGTSCYGSAEKAIHAEQSGANYVAFGRFFPSLTKPDAAPCKPEVLTTRKVDVPVVAIGGITPENGKALLSAGADVLAVIGGIFRQPDPAAAVYRYLQLFG